MAVGIPCKLRFDRMSPSLQVATGSAGLINTISMFTQGHIVAGVFGILSSIGWILQAGGGGLLYKKVWDFKNNNADITFAEVRRAVEAKFRDGLS